MTEYIVALTGGIGSGKTTVANNFAVLGVPLVDSDIIAREIVHFKSSILYDIKEYFGQNILKADGSLDRMALRTRIFNNSLEKTWLNNKLHPIIHGIAKQRLYSIDAPYAIWVVPLFIENNLHLISPPNRILVVDVEREYQIIRVLKRDNISREQIEKIIDSQVSRYLRLSYADDIIYTNDSTQNIMDDVFILHQRYLNFSKLVNK